MSPKRRPATPLVLVVLSLTAWQAIRLQTALAWYDVLGEFAPVPGPLYTALSGAAWLLVGAFVLWCLWQKKPWTAEVLLGAALAYSVWYWVDRLVLQAPHANWPFMLLVNVILLAYVLALSLPYLSTIAILKRGV
jgi:hypothetical protein